MKDLKVGQWVLLRAKEKEAIVIHPEGLAVLLMKVAGQHAAGVWMLNFPDGKHLGLPIIDDHITPAPSCFEPAGIEAGPMVVYVLCGNCKKTPLPPWATVGDNCTVCNIRN